jgi:hypothetical protein
VCLRESEIKAAFTHPGFLISLPLAFAVTGAVAGFLWLFVFGDKPWGSSTEILLPVLFILSFLLLWITSMTLGYSTGRMLESDQALNRNHILVSSGVTLALILVIVLHQLSIGNIGQQSDGASCSDFCSQKGYSGSGMPRRDSGGRSCSCYDNTGNEAVKVPLDRIAPLE